MAELAAADSFSPPIGISSDSNFIDPHLFPVDLFLPRGGLSSEIDLDFDDFDGIDWDISMDDLLLPEDINALSHPSDTSNDRLPPQSGALTSSPSLATSGSLNVCSPESGHSANCSTESGADFKQEEDKNGRVTKMMKKLEEECVKSNVKPRSSKSPWSEDFSSCILNAASKEDEKKKARLMRNRESAQLSRQRKKEYVEELEDKVRSMNSTIAELNSKISFVMAENASLKQQLGVCGSSGFSPGIYPPPSIVPMNFPWAPFPALAFRQQVSTVPLIPIPKLKSQQAAASQTAKKTEKKRESKIRKVASITFLGFFFFVLMFGGLIGRVDHGSDESRNFGAARIKNGLLGSPNGMVLIVSGRTRSVTASEQFAFNNGQYSKVGADATFQNGKVGPEDKSWPSNSLMITQNSSESLPALLYVPRNGKHVEINGNLIINSVLATEKGVAEAKSRDQPNQPSGNDGIETSLVIANLGSRMALSTRDISGRTKSYGSSAEYQPALSSNSEEAVLDTSQDGFLQQWFREGMTGQIFSSSACTEVFHFQISPSPASSSAVITSSIDNTTDTAIAKSNVSNTSSSPQQTVIKNRRFLYPQAIPLPGSTLNHTENIEKRPEGSSFQRNATRPPMVVSVLIDPKEASDNDVDGMKSHNKSLQRIFVVILIDSVKYVTYSCVLPFNTRSPHIFN